MALARFTSDAADVVMQYGCQEDVDLGRSQLGTCLGAWVARNAEKDLIDVSLDVSQVRIRVR